MEWFGIAELKGDRHFCVPLIATMRNGGILLVYWTADDFYDWNTHRKISHTVVLKVAVIEFDMETPNRETNLAEILGEATVGKKEEKAKGHNRFNIDTTDNPKPRTAGDALFGGANAAEEDPF